jgi:hypothetical protein
MRVRWSRTLLTALLAVGMMVAGVAVTLYFALDAQAPADVIESIIED